jgi:hypothetical protein
MRRKDEKMYPFYNQFILGPRLLEDLPQWQQFQLWGEYYLMAHPTLSVTRAENEKLSVCLIGYMLDPEHSEASSEDILKSLVNLVSQDMDLFAAIEPLGGRWIFVVKSPQSLRLIHDAAGLRQVYYSDAAQTEELWCASQPVHIAKACNLRMDRNAIEFIKWFQDKDSTFYWPGNSSPYGSICRLLPNHFLDLETGKTSRYWPSINRESCTLDDSVTSISDKLTKMMQSAANRFDLMVAMSAGWDSRLMLAACKPIARNLRYYTIKRPGTEMTHPDIGITSKLLKKLGLVHDLIEIRPQVSSQFEDIYDQQVPFTHKGAKLAMYTLFKRYDRQKVGATGNVSEVARCYYKRPDPLTKDVTTEYLMKVAHVDHPFARKHFDSWIQAIETSTKYNVLDLFYWEIRTGSWLAQKYLEFDTAWLDIFSPYNNRRLLIDMLSVEEVHRQGPSNELYRRLIEKMWPDILIYPINPTQNTKGLLNNLRRAVRPLKRLFR